VLMEMTHLIYKLETYYGEGVMPAAAVDRHFDRDIGSHSSITRRAS
jgi:hypothetical protein